MKTPESFVRYHKALLCCFSLMASLPFKESWSAEATEEGSVILRCFPPVGEHKQAGGKINAEYFDYLSLDQKERESILKQVVENQDGRKRVPKTSEFPYSAQVYFVAAFPGSPRGYCEIGSGTFIAPQVILTAGHVVYSHTYKSFFTSLKCSPAQDETIVPFPLPRVIGVKVAPAYIKEGKREHDYALVFIDREVGRETGCLGIIALEDKELVNSDAGRGITIAGYPSDKFDKIERPTMWHMSGAVKLTTPEEVFYDIDTYGGQSGSGIWYKRRENDYYLIGVHAYGASPQISSWNHGPRLTRYQGNVIKGWIEDFEKSKDKLKFFDDKTIMAKKISESNEKEADIPKDAVSPGEEGLPVRLLIKARKDNDPESQYEIGMIYANGQGIGQDDKKAFEWIQKAAGQSCLAAQIKLGSMYRYGQGTDPNEEKAFYWYTRAAEAGSPQARYTLSMMYYDENDDGKSIQNKELAFEYCKKALAGKGDYAEATGRLGYLYDEGIGAKQDYKKAFVHYFKAVVEKGFIDPLIQYRIARMYEEGQGTEANLVQALVWHKRAAINGHAEASWKLGEMYCQGHGVQQDMSEAWKWYEKAATQGYADAQYRLARMYEQGEGIGKDCAKAAEWHGKAAAQGHAKAQYCLGLLYEKGQGVTRDTEKALHWYKEAAQSPSKTAADAAFELGRLCYEKDPGRNKDEILKWYKKAAEKNHPGALYQLGLFYDTGILVKINKQEALKWYLKGSENGSIDSCYKLGEMYQEGKETDKDDTEALKWYQKVLDNVENQDRKKLGKVFEFVKDKKPGLYKERLLFESLRQGSSPELAACLAESGFGLHYRDPDTHQNIFHAYALSKKDDLGVLGILCRCLEPKEKDIFINSRDKDNYTPLDYALKGKNAEKLVILVLQGAFECDPFNGLTFYKESLLTFSPDDKKKLEGLKKIKEPSSDNRNEIKELKRRKDLKGAFLKLMKRNPSLEWQVSLDVLLPLAKTTAPDVIAFSSGEKRKFSENVRRQLQGEEQNQLTASKKAHQGRRKVSCAEGKGKVSTHGVYLKEYPALPGLEEASGRLMRNLLGFGAPCTELVNWDGRPVLISQSAGKEEDLLVNVLKSRPEVLDKLDEEDLSGMILTAMLTNPEDGKPDNYIVSPHPFKKGSFRIIGIDNDQAFVPAILREKGIKESFSGKKKGVPQVKTILYCLNQMKQSVPVSIQNKIINLRPESFLKQWLEELVKVDQWQKELFNGKKQEEFFKKHQSFLGVPFQEGAVSYLYEKFIELKGFLVSNPSLTHIELLSRLEPRLAKRYEEALGKNVSVAERFKETDEQFYEKGKDGSYTTTTRSGEILSSMNIVVEKGSSHTQNNPHLALEELEGIREKKHSQRLRELAIRAGVKDIGTDLSSEEARVKFLKDVTRETLPADQQEAILEYLTGQNRIRELTLKNFTALTDSAFKKLPLEDVTVIDLRGCERITSEALAELAKKASSLRVLNLAFLTRIKAIEKPGSLGGGATPLFFPRLEKLNVSGCVNLERVSVLAPGLKWLSMKDCKKLTDEVLDGLVQGTPFLRKLKVKGADRLSEPEWRERLPEFMYIESKKIKESGYDWVETILNAQKDELRLEKLSLSGKNNGARILCRALSKNPVIKKLDLTGNGIGAEGARELARNATLISLNLWGNKVSNEGARELARNTTLTSLYLQYNGIGSEGARELARNITLTSLNLQGNKVSDEGARELARNITLTFLSLAYNKVSDEGARELARNTTLTSLDLLGNSVSNEGVRELARNTTLTSLCLQHNGIGPEGARELARNTTLTSLYLAGNNINDEGARELAKNTTLTSLDLQHNGIGPEGARELARNTALTFLDLTGNSVSNEGARELAKNITLTSLYLQGNKVSDEGARELARNTTLTSLDLQHNGIGPEGARELAKNTTLTSLNLEGNDIGTEGEKAVSEVLSRNKKIALIKSSQKQGL